MLATLGIALVYANRTTQGLAALDRAGFPAVPPLGPLPPDAALRRLTVEAEGAARQVIIGWHRTPSLPGYAEAFDLIDAVIRQLRGDTVRYPTKHERVVYGAVPVQP